MPNPIIRIPADQFQLGEQASRTVDFEVTDPTFKAVHTLPSTTGQLVGTGVQTFSDDEKQQVKDNLGISGGGGGGSGDFSSNTTTSTDGQAVVFSGTGGKTGKRFTGDGYVSASGGVLSASATIPKADVGLGNADNTSDANKPVSTATQTALDLKADLASPALTGTPTAPTAAADTSTTQIATTAFAKAEADAAQSFAIQRANHTGTQAASTISDFNSAARAQTEAELIAGTNVTITPGSSGATRTLTISASGGSGGGDVSVTGTPTSGQIAEWTSATAIQGKAVTGSGSVVLATSPTLVTPALGTPSAAVLTNGTGLPISTGVSGLGTGVATFLATPSSANLRAALTDEVGTGEAYFVGGALGTPASVVLTNATAVPAGQVVGVIPIANLATGTPDGTKFVRDDGTLATPAGGGGSGDMLSTLTAAEISITTTATATISRMHVCSGTTADYTVTLPAVSGNTGKFVGFRMAPGLTKFVTIDGNGSETIDGATTRVMRMNEAAILFCDGSTWTKVAGKTMPIVISARDNGSDQSISATTIVTLDLATAITDTYSNVDLTNNTITIPRAGTWGIYFKASLYDFSASTAEVDAAVNLNGTDNYQRDRRYVGFVGSGTATQSYPTLNISVDLAAADVLKPTLYVGNVTAKTLAGFSVYSTITLREIATW